MVQYLNDILFAEILLYFSLFTISSLILFNLWRFKELNYINPFFWAAVLVFIYFTLPSIFVNDINYYFNWGITKDSIKYSHYLVSFITIFFAISYHMLPIKHFKYPLVYFPEKPIYLLWLILSTYLIYVLLHKLNSGQLSMNINYTGQTDVYRLKSVAYLAVSISVLLYFKFKKLFVFTPNLIIILLDLLAGSRTTALIVIIPMFLAMSILNKKMYLMPITIGISLLVTVGLIRSGNIVSGDVPVHINMLGEFRETYITLPLFVMDNNFVGKGDIVSFLSSLFLGVLQPLRGAIMEAAVFPGSYAQGLIGRGYGLGSNMILDAFYYGYYFIPISIILCFMFCLFSYFLVKTISVPYAVAYASMFVIFLRLAIREGIYLNLGLFVFILLFYMLPIFYLNSKKIGFVKIRHK